jgi:hypothetical protein
LHVTRAGGVENDIIPTVQLQEKKKPHTSKGKLKHGDMVLAINGVNVVGEPHSAVATMLQVDPP